jgi:hypothetical protein
LASLTLWDSYMPTILAAKPPVEMKCGSGCKKAPISSAINSVTGALRQNARRQPSNLDVQSSCKLKCKHSEKLTTLQNGLVA